MENEYNKNLKLSQEKLHSGGLTAAGQPYLSIIFHTKALHQISIEISSE